MTWTVDELKAALLSLPEDERAEVVDAALASLAEPPELSDAWKTEIERRRREIAEGETELIDNDEVFAQVRARLR